MRLTLIVTAISLVCSFPGFTEEVSPMTLEQYLRIPFSSNQHFLAGLKLPENANETFYDELIEGYVKGEIKSHILLEVLEKSASSFTNEMMSKILDGSWEIAQKNKSYRFFYRIASLYGSSTEAPRIMEALKLEFRQDGLEAIYAVGRDEDLANVRALNEKLISEKKISKLIMKNVLHRNNADGSSNFITLERKQLQSLFGLSNEERSIYFTFNVPHSTNHPDFWDWIRAAIKASGPLHSLRFAQRNILPDSYKSSYHQLLTECFPDDTAVHEWLKEKRHLESKNAGN